MYHTNTGMEYEVLMESIDSFHQWTLTDQIQHFIDIELFEFSSISVKLQRNFAQTKTAVLSWYVQNFIVIGKLFFKISVG